MKSRQPLWWLRWFGLPAVTLGVLGGGIAYFSIGGFSLLLLLLLKTLLLGFILGLLIRYK